jgi:hypothetical protein
MPSPNGITVVEPRGLAVASLAPSESKALEQHAKAIDAAKIKTVESIFEIGKHLKAAHDLLANHGDGVFCKWVNERCGFTPRSARNYMGVVDAFDGKDWERLSQSCTAEALYLLSRDTTPEDCIDDAIAAAESGERITLRKAKELAEKYTVGEATESDEPEAWALYPCIEKLHTYVERMYERWPKDDLPALPGKLRCLADEIEAGTFSGAGSDDE